MGGPLAEHPQLGLAQGGEFAHPLFPLVAVESLHEEHGGVVVHLPHAGDQVRPDPDAALFPSEVGTPLL